MGNTVTLGGDRLGAGKKQKVHLHGFERSTHDLSYAWRSSMAAGTLVPFMKVLALPGDTFDINLECDIKTHPTIGPLFGSYKVQLDTFLAPIRLYNSWLHNNKLNVGRNMAQVKLPQIKLTLEEYDEAQVTDWDNSQINPSSLLAYMGIRGIGQRSDAVGNITRDFNAIPIIAYFDIYKNYYANKQEEIGAVIHSPAEANVETVNAITVTYATDPSTPIPITLLPTQTSVYIYTGTLLEIDNLVSASIPSQIMLETVEHGFISAEELTGGMTANGIDWGAAIKTQYTGITITGWRYRLPTDTNNGIPRIATFDLENIDTIRETILTTNGGTPYYLTDEIIPPYSWIDQRIGGTASRMSTQELLALKTYQSDLFNNWLSTEWIDGPGGINEITAVDTSDGNFKIDALILARKVYDMLNRIAVSGGTYNDWQNAVYDHEPYRQCYTPMYMGGLSKELVFQEVISNSETSDQPLGTLAGRGVLTGKHKGGHVTIKVDEPAYIIGIISLTPRIDYSQGNDWDTRLETMDDLHKPGLDQIGFQELTTEQMAWWDVIMDTGEWRVNSAGKQPAWINYMTAVNKTLGNFAVQPGGTGGGEMFMTLNRRYEKGTIAGQGIQDLTTYIDPSKYNQIFAETTLDAQNFWAQIGVGITARRKMSAKIMPNL